MTSDHYCLCHTLIHDAQSGFNYGHHCAFCFEGIPSGFAASLTFSGHVQHAKRCRATNDFLCDDSKAVDVSQESSSLSLTGVSQQLRSRPKKVCRGKRKKDKQHKGKLMIIQLFACIYDFWNGWSTYPQVFPHPCQCFDWLKFHWTRSQWPSAQTARPPQGFGTWGVREWCHGGAGISSPVNVKRRVCDCWWGGRGGDESQAHFLTLIRSIKRDDLNIQSRRTSSFMSRSSKLPLVQCSVTMPNIPESKNKPRNKLMFSCLMSRSWVGQIRGKWVLNLWIYACMFPLIIQNI